MSKQLVFILLFAVIMHAVILSAYGGSFGTTKGCHCGKKAVG